jgi:hypothetical protein
VSKEERIEPGMIVRTRNWPSPGSPLSADRYLVRAIRQVPSSQWPIQVDALLIDRSTPGLLGVRFAAFPIECAVRDKQFERTYYQRKQRTRREERPE